jgi:hypothetical protein
MLPTSLQQSTKRMLGKLAGTIIALCLVSLITACASKPAQRSGPTSSNTPTTSSSGRTDSPSPPNTGSRPAASGSKNTPIPDQPIDIAGNCSQKEEDGFREEATVSIQANEVKQLSWRLWVGKRGSCQFDGNDFVQTQKRPSIELKAKDGSACKLLIWQATDRVTLAHANCQARCTPGIYDDAWPVMFHPKNGSCAKLG